MAPHNKQLQRTVIDKVPMHMRQRAAGELRRYAAAQYQPTAVFGDHRGLALHRFAKRASCVLACECGSAWQESLCDLR